MASILDPIGVFDSGIGGLSVANAIYDLLPAESLSEPIIEYEPKIGFNAGIGFSAPIYTLLHWEIGYMFNYIKWDAQSAANLPAYDGYHHSIQVGLSLNLVFGKVAAKCRRLIKSDRSNRGFR